MDVHAVLAHAKREKFCLMQEKTEIIVNMLISNNSATLVFVILLALAFDYSFRPTKELSAIDVYQALGHINTETEKDLRVMVGFNVCVDLLVGSEYVIPKESDVRPDDRSGILSSIDDVYSVFLKYHSVGLAGERSVESDVFIDLLNFALSDPKAYERIGGNAALMAETLASIGYNNVHVGGRVGPKLLSMLNRSISLLLPPAASDEVHLILEYRKESYYNGQVAPRANRFILTSDIANTEYDTMERIIREADHRNAEAFVIAGLHMLETLDASARLTALISASNALRTRKGSYPVHMEITSSFDLTWSHLVAQYIFPYVDSIGFNAHEASFLYTSLMLLQKEHLRSQSSANSDQFGSASNVRVELPQCLSPDVVEATIHECGDEIAAEVLKPNPNVSAVATLIRFFFESYPSISRIHFHSSSYQIIAYAYLPEFMWEEKAYRKDMGEEELFHNEQPQSESLNEDSVPSSLHKSAPANETNPYPEYQTIPKVHPYWNGGPEPVVAGSIMATFRMCEKLPHEQRLPNLSSSFTSLRRFSYNDPREEGTKKEFWFDKQAIVHSWTWAYDPIACSPKTCPMFYQQHMRPDARENSLSDHISCNSRQMNKTLCTPFEKATFGDEEDIDAFMSQKRIQFQLAPVVACRTPLSVVGLSDAISAAAFAKDVRRKAPRES